MRLIAVFLLLFLVVSSDAKADVIDVVFDGSNSSSSTGTIGETADGLSANGGSPADISFSVSGLTIDAVGSGDDSLSFTLRASGTGDGGIEGFGFSSGDWGVNSTGGDTANQFDRIGESMTWNFVDATVSLGAGSSQIGQVTFTGFTGFELTAFGSGDRYDLSGTSEDGTALATDPLTFLPTSSFTISYNDNGGANNGFRISDIGARFDVSAVPEPAVPACFLCLGLIFSRVRRDSRRNA